MQAVSSLPLANINLVCFEKPLLLWLQGVAAWRPLENCACHFSFRIKFWETLERAAHMLFGKAWPKHELLFIYFLGNICLGVQDCFALTPRKAYPVSISCCDCDLAINSIKAEIPSGIPKEAAGPQESTGWHLGGSLHFFWFTQQQASTTSDGRPTGSYGNLSCQAWKSFKHCRQKGFEKVLSIGHFYSMLV